MTDTPGDLMLNDGHRRIGTAPFGVDTLALDESQLNVALNCLHPWAGRDATQSSTSSGLDRSPGLPRTLRSECVPVAPLATKQSPLHSAFHTPMLAQRPNSERSHQEPPQEAPRSTSRPTSSSSRPTSNEAPILNSQRVLEAIRCDRVHRFRLIARAYFFHESSCGRRITTVGGRRGSADRGNDRGRGRCGLGGQSGRPHCGVRDRTTRQQLIARAN